MLTLVYLSGFIGICFLFIGLLGSRRNRKAMLTIMAISAVVSIITGLAWSASADGKHTSTRVGKYNDSKAIYVISPADVLLDQASFVGASVWARGTVGKHIDQPFLGTDYYLLYDGDGIWKINTKVKMKTGASVTVKGVVAGIETISSQGESQEVPVVVGYDVIG